MKKKIMAICAVLIIVSLGVVGVLHSLTNENNVSDIIVNDDTQQKDTVSEEINSSDSIETETTEINEEMPETENETIEAVTEAKVYEDEDPWVTANRVIPDEIPEFEQGDLIVFAPDDPESTVNYKYLITPTYRAVYYWWTIRFDGLLDDVSEEEMREFLIENYCWHKDPSECTEEPSEMFLVTIIKHFHITKEEYIEACEKTIQWRNEKYKNRLLFGGKNWNHEYLEIPNADIIYTFDNEIINNYFRRDICEYTSAEEYYEIIDALVKEEIRRAESD